MPTLIPTSTPCDRSSVRFRSMPIVLFGMLLACASPSLTCAQDVPLAGQQEWHRLDVGAGLGTSKSDFDRGATFAASVRYYPTRSLALEGEAGWWNGHDDALFRPLHGTTELSGNLLLGGFGQRVNPYFGFGLCHSTATVTADRITSADSATNIHFILGLDVRVAGRVSAFATARFRPLVVGDFDGWRSVKRYQAGIRVGL